jgi:hypothetical protein
VTVKFSISILPGSQRVRKVRERDKRSGYEIDEEDSLVEVAAPFYGPPIQSNFHAVEREGYQ